MFLTVTVHKLNYEVIKIFHEDNQKNLELTGRGESASTPVIRLQAFDQDYTLYLEGNNDVLLGEKVKLYLANVEDSNIVYTEMDYVRSFLINLVLDSQT